MAKWLISLLIIVFDQLSKILVINFYPHLVSFNQGISFGWLAGKGWLLINGILLVVLGLIYVKNQSLAMVLILAGGLSNFFDRIIWGSIVDWIKIPILLWSFNAADAVITMGVIIKTN